jgi:hypothetical protein
MHFNKQFDKKINKEKMNFQSNNATFFNPSWSNKLYFKGPDGWFYELNQNNFQTKTQRYEHKRDVSQKYKNISKEKPKTQAQGLKKAAKIHLLKVVRSLKHVYFIIIVVILIISHLIANIEKKTIS